ncbi:MAG TPA: hypothetical protein VHW68_01360 [Actinomycetota bacterium]|nr:hypothetical protein [Actinomycetota bacterium]
MRTPERAGASRPSWLASGVAHDLFEHGGDVADRHEGDADDVWAFEVWLSREDAFVEGDTWHAGKVRGLRSMIAEIVLGR